MVETNDLGYPYPDPNNFIGQCIFDTSLRQQLWEQPSFVLSASYVSLKQGRIQKIPKEGAEEIVARAHPPPLLKMKNSRSWTCCLQHSESIPDQNFNFGKRFAKRNLNGSVRRTIYRVVS